jgi:glutaredoxin
MSKGNFTMKNVLKNIALTVGAIVLGVSVGSYAPEVKTFIADLGNGSENIQISKQYENKVVLFGRDSCPYCRQGIALLDKLNINYVYLNVEEDSIAMAQFNEINEEAVPVLIVGSNRLRGFIEESWYDTLSELN